jgi:CDP-diacylglycerol--glycerol-3-phosphate 3-phosphatidyltransferase
VPYAFFQFLDNANAAQFALLTLVVIALDGVDGIVARKLNQATEFGAKLDIFADRIVELAYWYFFAYIGVLHIWVFWFFLIRGLAVDYLSRKNTKPLGDSFLRSSRFMRGAYGTLKLLSFALLILIPSYSLSGVNISLLVTYLTVFICALRALPVILSAVKSS